MSTETIAVNPYNIHDIRENFDDTDPNLQYSFDYTIVQPEIFIFFLQLFLDSIHQKYLLTSIKQILLNISKNQGLFTDFEFVETYVNELFAFFNILFQNNCLSGFSIFNIVLQTIFTLEHIILLDSQSVHIFMDISILIPEEEKPKMYEYITHCYHFTLSEESAINFHDGYSYLMINLLSDLRVIEPNMIRSAMTFADDTSIDDFIYQNIESLQVSSEILQEIVECIACDIINNTKLTYHMPHILSYLDETKDSELAIGLCILLIENIPDFGNRYNVVDFFNILFTRIPILLYSRLTGDQIKALFVFLSDGVLTIFQLQMFLNSIISVKMNNEILQKIREPLIAFEEIVKEYENHKEPFFIFFNQFILSLYENDNK